MPQTTLGAPRPHRNPLCQPFTLWLTAALALFAALLAAVAIVLDPNATERLFSETGLVERASVWAWVGLGVFAIALFRASAGAVAGAIVVLAAAAREADWHKEFTGYSVLKPAFYVRDEFALHQQVIAGALVLVLIVAIVVLVRRTLRHLRSAGRPLPGWAVGAAMGFLLVVGTKALDRAPAILEEDVGLPLSPRIDALAGAWEEGLESVVPLVFAAACVAFYFEVRRRGRDAASG